MEEITHFPPEVEQGNIEYKLRLVGISEERMERLISQMKWRLQEGQGEAIYRLGVDDDGRCVGLSQDEMKHTIDTVNKMTERLEANWTTLRKFELPIEGDLDTSNERTVIEVLVRKVPDNQQFLDLRVSVLGNADAGKSTLLGVLTQGEMDNGRGRARLNLFRHLHEIESGRTSSISHEILGFDDKGEVVNYSESRTAEDICSTASKIITFMDLAGHHKYMRTTVFGLTSHCPDFAMLVVSANKGIAGTTREHLGLAQALCVPTFAVVTKLDLCLGNTTNRASEQLKRLLKSCGKNAFCVESIDDVYKAANLLNDKSPTSFVPIFKVSSVTGSGLSLLTKFFNVLPQQKNVIEQEELMTKPTEFQVEELFQVPGVGPVVGGTLIQGTVKENDVLVMGPTVDGEYLEVEITSIRRNRAPCMIARAGQAASLSLDRFPVRKIRKGMVILSKDALTSVRPSHASFDANLFLLYHPKPVLSRNFQVTVHVNNVRQTAVIESIQNKKGTLSTNEQALVTFRFVKSPEYLRLNSTIIIREKTTKGVGKIKKIHSYNPETNKLALQCRSRKLSTSILEPPSKVAAVQA